MQSLKGIVFLDRDGVLNQEIGDYVYREADFLIAPGVAEGLKALKEAGYILWVVTNQGGISRGLYTAEAVRHLYQVLQEQVGQLLDGMYFAPWVDQYSKSLFRKPGSLMLERAMGLYQMAPEQCFLIGDAGRDLEAAAAVGVKPILLPTLKEKAHPLAAYVAEDFLAATNWILAQSQAKYKG